MYAAFWVATLMRIERITRRCRWVWLVIGCCLVGCDEKAAKPQAAAAGENTQAATVSSEVIEQSLTAAQVYLDTQDVAKAQVILFTLLDRAPNEMRAREMLGQSFVLSANHAQTRGDAALAVELRQAAYDQYRIVAASAGDSAPLQHSAGMIAMHSGDAAAALEHFQNAARLDETDPKYPLYAAQVLIQFKRFDEAEAAIQQVLQHDPDEPLAHASLAMIALDRKEFDAALTHMMKAREIQPGDLGIRVQHAKVLRISGQPQRALELLVGLAEADRTKEFVAYELAASYTALNRHPDAAGVWVQVQHADVAAPQAWLAAVRAGECWVRAGNLEEAAACLRQAQLAAPNAPQVTSLQDAISSAVVTPPSTAP